MNLWHLPPLAEQEVTDTLVRGDQLRLERIVSTGQVSPPGFWYEQDEDEWVCVLQGEGEVTDADGTIHRLTTGDTLLIPAGRRHRVSYTSQAPPCLWLCLFGRFC